jgi:Lar family restriction alleviation protein
MMPCPFCGVKAYFIDQGVRQLVECGGCGVEMEGLDREDAIAHWNTRADLPQEDDRELVEKLRGIAKYLPTSPSEDLNDAADRLLQLSRDVDLLREENARLREKRKLKVAPAPPIVFEE